MPLMPLYDFCSIGCREFISTFFLVAKYLWIMKMMAVNASVIDDRALAMAPSL